MTQNHLEKWIHFAKLELEDKLKELDLIQMLENTHHGMIACLSELMANF